MWFSEQTRLLALVMGCAILWSLESVVHFMSMERTGARFRAAAAWSTSVIHFSHGTLTPKTSLWKVLRDTQLVGGYWPPTRPARFF